MLRTLASDRDGRLELDFLRCVVRLTDYQFVGIHLRNDSNSEMYICDTPSTNSNSEIVLSTQTYTNNSNSEVYFCDTRSTTVIVKSTVGIHLVSRIIVRFTGGNT